MFLCEDSIDGVFSGIYEVWAGKYNRNEVVIKAGGAGNYELFVEYKQIKKNVHLAQKVTNTIRRRFGEDVYKLICYALWTCADDKADAIYRMVRFGIEKNCGCELANMLTEDSVQRVFELYRSSYNEAHHYLGFVRFVELNNGVLYAEIKPKNFVLEPVAEHFVDRLPGENWIIQDMCRKKAAIHWAYGQWMIVESTMIEPIIRQKWKHTEEEFQEMWKMFCQSISIEARENLKLQRQNLPLRFRDSMVEYR